jgi:mannose-6-phosphate isomerase
MLYPLTFHPILKERVWGGRNLERLYQKPLPPEVPIGESWEISDRPDSISVIAHGPLAGKDLRWLMENHAKELLGEATAQAGRFPLLIKIIDAREVLSVQVHPPAWAAAQFGGEAKTELWYVTEAAPGAELLVGLKRGATRAEFERRIADGTVAECLHHIPVKADDAMFLPSGRLHAIGGGLVLFEVQQNSDTTYRVFDWNRTGLDGRPRELHVAPSLASIDFNDHEPGLIQSRFSRNPVIATRYLLEHPLFTVNGCRVKRGQRFHLRSASVQIVGLLRGRLRLTHGSSEVGLNAGQFALLPACLERVTLTAEQRAEFLHIEAGHTAEPHEPRVA